ncbi:hypothetical protein AAC387_Pa02g0078 [Persea americana]
MADSAKVENESENGSEEQNRTDGSVNGSGAAFVCLTRFAGDSAAGAVMGSIFGYGPFFSTPSSRLYQTHLVSSHLGCFLIWGSGLLKKKGFKGSFADAGSSAKTFAVLSGVHSLVICVLKRLRGKDDVINAGVAGCCTGLALSFPGAPQALLQSCLTFGAFSFIIEGLNKQQPALARPLSLTYGVAAQHAVLPPFTLAFPLKESFSTFCKCSSTRII